MPELSVKTATNLQPSAAASTTAAANAVEPQAAAAATALAGVVVARPRELGGPAGLEPTRYGDWEKSGRCIDF
jgi:hypothetical protein